MKLPAKVEYACRAIIELGLHFRAGELVQIQYIADKHNIPKKFLVQILMRLRHAKIVTSTRGISGGYKLAVNPEYLTIADVITAVDDTIITNSINKEETLTRKNKTERILHRIFGEVNHRINDYLCNITVDTVLNELNNEQLTYQI